MISTSVVRSSSPALLEQQTISQVGFALFAAFSLGGAILAAGLGSRAPLFAGVLIGLYLMFSIKVASQWQRVAVLRLGRYRGLRGPGMFHIIPIVDTISKYVDQRIRISTISAESTLTRDTVPVNVDAIFLWLVWNAEKCILEVQNFDEAITMSAQTALRESIGRHELSQMITDREALGRQVAHQAE